MKIILAFASLGLSLNFAQAQTTLDDFTTKTFATADKIPAIRLEHFVVNDVEELGTVVGSFKKNRYLTSNDIIYLKFKNPAVSVGDTFSIFNPQGEIKNRGHRIHIKGFVKITSVLPSAIIGRIQDATSDIGMGDKIGPNYSIQVNVDPHEPAQAVTGKIAAPTKEGALLGAYDFAYLDRGESDGLKLNDMLEVVRTVDGSGDLKPDLPHVPIAKLVVVQLAQKTAVAYCLSAADSFEAGSNFRSAISEVKYLDDKNAANPPDQSATAPQPPANPDSPKN